MNFSSISTKVVATSLLLVSTTGLAFAKHHAAPAPMSYKGEANLKGEAPCPIPPTLKSGFYIGAQAGYDSYRIRHSFSYSVPGVFGVNGNPAISATGWMGGLFLGYGQYLSDLFYLGGEIFGNLSGAESNYSFTHTIVGTPGTSSTFNGKAEANGSWGLALVPGLKLNDTSLGYIKLGWTWVNTKASGTFTTNVPGVSNFSGSKTNTTNGFDLGVGIETLVYDAWSVRTEYNHTWLNSYNTAFTSINPSDNQFTVGVLYHFG